jgi:hypothetical protein
MLIAAALRHSRLPPYMPAVDVRKLRIGNLLQSILIFVFGYGLVASKVSSNPTYSVSSQCSGFRFSRESVRPSSLVRSSCFPGSNKKGDGKERWIVHCLVGPEALRWINSGKRTAGSTSTVRGHSDASPLSKIHGRVQCSRGCTRRHCQKRLLVHWMYFVFIHPYSRRSRTAHSIFFCLGDMSNLKSDVTRITEIILEIRVELALVAREFKAHVLFVFGFGWDELALSTKEIIRCHGRNKKGGDMKLVHVLPHSTTCPSWTSQSFKTVFSSPLGGPPSILHLLPRMQSVSWTLLPTSTPSISKHLSNLAPSPILQFAPMTDSLMLHFSCTMTFSPSSEFSASTRHFWGIVSLWAILEGCAKGDAASLPTSSIEGSLARRRETVRRRWAVSTRRIRGAVEVSGCT